MTRLKKKLGVAPLLALALVVLVGGAAFAQKHAHTLNARLAAVIPRPVRVRDFMYAVACALKEFAMADPV